jgi:tRNA-2-methylthio-N6-dimethylallyladenosine synthase
VTLLGQIVTSYGRRLIPVRDNQSPFVQLLDAVHEVEGLRRIRFTSPHPKGYGDDLVAAYERLPRLCPSAHLPVQSGSDRVLKLMHRGYNRERFLEIATKLRAARPGIGLSTDLIVGFPGETEEDFQATLDLVGEVAFDNAFVFKYSPRKNTPAAEMPGQVPTEVIEERHARLFERVNERVTAKLGAMVGRIEEVLVEGPSRKNPARLAGRTGCYKIVVFEGSPRHVGQVMNLRITRASNVALYGDPAIVNLD